MEVAVGDGIDLGDVHADRSERILDPNLLRVVPRVELVVAKPEPGIEQQQPTPMPDEIAHHDTLKPRPLITRKLERAKLERHDLRGPDVTHGELLASVA